MQHANARNRHAHLQRRDSRVVAHRAACSTAMVARAAAARCSCEAAPRVQHCGLALESTLKQGRISWFGETRPRTRSWGRSVCHRRLDGAPAARMKMHIPWLQAVTLLVRAGPGTCRPRFSCACWPRARGRRDARRARAAVVHSSAGCMQACPLRAASALQRPPPPRTRWRAWDAPRSPACGAQHCRLVLPTHSRTPQRAAGLPVCVRACMGACVTV